MGVKMLKAIVVGIEKYPKMLPGIVAQSDLAGVTDDALNFYNWLRSDGRLHDDEISLHLSAERKETCAKAATYYELQQAIELLGQSAGQIDRLYFFFAGHGFSFQQNFSGELEDVIVCEEFETLRNMAPAIRVREIIEWLRPMGPCDQYFFFDCCRNVVANAPLNGAHLNLNRKPDPSISRSPSGALFAALPGATTKTPSPFTTTLLQGLRGTGTARRWQDSELVVTFDSLCQYVAKKLDQQGEPPPFADPWGIMLHPFLRIYRQGFGDAPLERCPIEVRGVRAEDVLLARAAVGRAQMPPIELPGGHGTLQLEPHRYLVGIESPDGTYVIAPAMADVDGSESEPAPLTFEAVRFHGLGVVLASLYDNNEDACIVSKDALISWDWIAVDKDVLITWNSILTEAWKRKLLPKLLQRAQMDYPRDARLLPCE